MSPIQIVCPVCRQPFQIDSAFAGGPAGCPHCRSAVLIPAVEAPPPAPRASGWIVAGSSSSDVPGAPGYSPPTPQPGLQGYANAGVAGTSGGYANGGLAPLSVGGGSQPLGMPGLAPQPGGPLGLPPLEPQPAANWNTLVFVCGVGVVGVLLVGLAVVVATTSARKNRLEIARNVAAPPEATPNRSHSTTPARAVVPPANPPLPQRAAWPSTQTSAANGAFPSAAPSPEPKSAASTSRAASSTTGPPTLLELPDLVERVEPAVVRIETNHDSLGSGFVVRENGVVVTNYHVVEGARECKAIFNDKRSVRVLGYLAISPERDLAVLQLEPGSYPTMPVASERVRKGEKVAAFGAPLGLGFTTSEGNISAIRDGEEIRETTQRRNTPDDMVFLQTTAPVSPGNSGGPLTDFRGRVVGVNTMVINARGAQNLNFAVSAEDVHRVLDAASTRVQSFSSMPRATRPTFGGFPSSEGGPRPSSPGSRLTIALPSGRVFDPARDFVLDLEAIQRSTRSLAQNNGLVRTEYPSGRPQAMMGHQRRVLQGAALVLAESSKMEALLVFDRGQRDGTSVFFGGQGMPVLFSQHENGRRQGFTMFVEGVQAVLLQEHEGDRLLWSHLFRDGWTLDRSFDHARDPVPRDRALQAALEKLTEAEAELKASEEKVRKWIRTARL